MEQESKANPSDPTWREIAACVLIGATLVSAYYSYSLAFIVIALGLSAVTMGMLSVSESLRLVKKSEE